MKDAETPDKSRRVRWERWLLAGLAGAFLLLSAWSSPRPDGLEFAAGEIGLEEGDSVLPVSLLEVLPREWMARAAGLVLSGIVAWVLVRVLASAASGAGGGASGGSEGKE